MSGLQPGPTRKSRAQVSRREERHGHEEESNGDEKARDAWPTAKRESEVRAGVRPAPRGPVFRNHPWVDARL